MADHWDEAYKQGQQDMLAKCIAAVEALQSNTYIPVATAHERCPDPTIHTRWTPVVTVPDALAALRALQEKP
jgi:hypothetical protein